jgi:cbb3-type cytochrome oxidase maturation protein
MDLLTIWILYAVVGVTLFSALFVWAVRSGQFRDQQRARHLPLQCPQDGECSGQPTEERDRGE